jgi:cell wall-associated NlpC family hydrolase
MASPINSTPNGCRTTASIAGFKQAAPAVVPASYATPAVANDWGDRLVSRAMKYLGTPYRNGGTSPSTGFDCSGFVYYLYGAVFGQSIPRMPHEMAREGTPVARSDLKRGDLVFFGTAAPSPTSASMPATASSFMPRVAARRSWSRP